MAAGNVCLGSLGARVLMPMQERREGPAWGKEKQEVVRRSLQKSRNTH